MILKSATAVLKITSPQTKTENTWPKNHTQQNQTKPKPHLNAQSFFLLLS